MSASGDIFATGWFWNAVVALAALATAAGYARVFRDRSRWTFFLPAVAIAVAALTSPLNALANGVLFSAHMLQHILLLLIVPALVVLSLPVESTAEARGGPPRSAGLQRQTRNGAATVAFGWAAGVGSMWLWHAPALCDAAATRPVVHALQAVSLLGLGAAFWWPILASRTANRLGPAHAIAYLFTACLACSALGGLLTLTPVEVCASFRAPLDTANAWAPLRDAIGSERDRQIGGLLMWVPMCLVYLGAIVWELARWMGGATAPQEEHA